MIRKRITVSEKDNRKKVRNCLILAGVIAAACFFAVFMSNRGGHAASLLRGNNSETETLSYDTTSTSYRYQQEFVHTLWNYESLRQLYFHDYSTAIPGLENTCFSASSSDQMVPQGICVAGDYMLISAYDKSGTEKSVLYVLSNEDPANRELLTTIVLPDKNHVGGIAFDGSSLWVAKSSSRRLSEIFYEQVEAAVLSNQSVYELEEYDGGFNCGVTASFVSYQDGRLWVGTSHSIVSRQGTLTVFRRAEDGNNAAANRRTGAKDTAWIRQFTMTIPDHAQGIAFFSEDGKDYLLLSTSHGRNKSSYYYLYEETISDEKAVLSPAAKIEMPPMAEEMVSDGAYTYCLFESAATCYSMGEGLRCEYPVDRICALINQLLVGSI